MIRCQLIRVSRNRRGQPVRESQPVQAETLRIGRGADCEIHLPDPRVNLQHARITRGSDGHLHIEADRPTLYVNDAFDLRARLVPGLAVGVGPYRFTVEAATDGTDLVLAMELQSPLPDDRSGLQARSRTTLKAAGLSRRAAAVALVTLVLLLFLLLPLLPSRSPELREASRALPIGLDQSWDVGPLSPGHVGFGRDCVSCHAEPFVQVRDEACTACHADLPNHMQDATVQQAVFGDTRCASCHREHKGPDLAQRDASLCVDCHADAGRTGIAGVLPAISDFHDAHPEFRYSLIAAAAEPAQVSRVAPTREAPLREASGLVFPHAVHLDAAGVNSPAGRTMLECSSCHIAEPNGLAFEPITMEGQCASCHRLEFEPAVTTRQLPHAAPVDVMTTLREFYARIALGETPLDVHTVNGLLQRPGAGKNEAQRQQALAWAEDKAMAVAREVFEVRVCTTCHVVQAQDDTVAPWRIAPVALQRDWLPKARFAHGDHRSQTCTECHAVTTSEHATDVAMPGIDTCRSCHAGAHPERGQMPSDCSTCHGFHGTGFAHPTAPPERTP